MLVIAALALLASVGTPSTSNVFSECDTTKAVAASPITLRAVVYISIGLFIAIIKAYASSWNNIYRSKFRI